LGCPGGGQNYCTPSQEGQDQNVQGGHRIEERHNSPRSYEKTNITRKGATGGKHQIEASKRQLTGWNHKDINSGKRAQKLLGVCRNVDGKTRGSGGVASPKKWIPRWAGTTLTSGVKLLGWWDSTFTFIRRSPKGTSGGRRKRSILRGWHCIGYGHEWGKVD